MKSTAIGVLGALIGAAVGFFAYWGLLTQGLYAAMLIGACAGWGAGFAKSSSRAVPLASGAIALVAAVIAEWITFPFIADESLAYFLMNFMKVLPLHLIFIALGTAAAVWFAWPRYAAPAASASR